MLGLYMGVCTTRRWQTSGRLMLETNVSTVHVVTIFLSNDAKSSLLTNCIVWLYMAFSVARALLGSNGKGQIIKVF